MRSFPLVLVCSVAVVVSLGCAGEEPEAVTGDEAPVPRRETSPTEPAADDREEPMTDRIVVDGRVMTDQFERVAGREVVVVDANGERRDLVTDGRGRFVLDEVVPPYDLAIAGGPAGLPTVVVGLERSDPYVELFERDGPTARPPAQTLRIGVPLPACAGAPDGACSLIVASGSISGGGTATAGCDGVGGGVAVVDVGHAWRRARTASNERIEAHVLTRCGDPPTAYAYARIDDIAAAPGETTDVGVAKLAAVPAMDPISVGVTDAGDLAPWSWTTEVSLDVPGGLPRTEFVFIAAASATAQIRLPFLPSSNLRVRVTARELREGAAAGYLQVSEGWSGARPVVPLGPPPEVMAVDVEPAPQMVRPLVDGSMSRREAGFSWVAGAPGLATLVVVDERRGALFRVFTEDEEVSLGRLEALGLHALHEGPHVVDLTTTARREVDEAFSPDVNVRERHKQGTRASAATHLRASFEVQ